MASKKVVISAMLGSVIEFYDFSLYGYFSSIIAELFFPQSDQFISLMYAFGVFAAGYLARPIGGIIFSHFTDKLGRKKILTFSIMLMAASTFILGLIPSYQSIGIFAPIALIIVRLMQGIAVAGELTSSIIFLSEHASHSKRGVTSSYAFIGIAIGMLLAVGVTISLTFLLNKSDLTNWGWRIAFLSGIFLGAIGVYIRLKIDETPPFKAFKNSGLVLKIPFLDVLKKHPKSIFITFITAALAGSIFYTAFIYMPSYLSTIAGLPLSNAIFVNSIGLLAYAIILPIMAIISDKFGRTKVIILACIAIIFLSYPIFLLMAISRNIVIILLMQVLLSTLMAGCVGPMSAFWTEIFPTKNRASGFSLGYNFGITLFGGFAPLLATWMTKFSGNQQAACFLIILLALSTLIAMKTTHYSNHMLFTGGQHDYL